MPRAAKKRKSRKGKAAARPAAKKAKAAPRRAKARAKKPARKKIAKGRPTKAGKARAKAKKAIRVRRMARPSGKPRVRPSGKPRARPSIRPLSFGIQEETTLPIQPSFPWGERVEAIAEGLSPEHIEGRLRPESDEGGAEGAKYDIGVAHNAEALAAGEVPAEYFTDRATILVVDPRLVFAYWEVTQTAMMDAASGLGTEARLTLRFYDITSTRSPEGAPSWDIEVFDRLGNWYLRLEHPDQLLCLDVGMKGPAGEFRRIARSNLLRLPPASLAHPGPIKWMVVTPSGERLVSDEEEYTDADLALLKRILGPHFYDLLMRGRFASIVGSSLEAVFFDVGAFRAGESPAGRPPWTNP